MNNYFIRSAQPLSSPPNSLQLYFPGSFRNVFLKFQPICDKKNKQRLCVKNFAGEDTVRISTRMVTA